MKDHGKEKVIFIADDDNAVRASLQKYLISCGFHVRGLEDGLSLILLCQHLTPDLIISDIRMPCMDGISLIQELQKREETKNIPVIFISAFYDSDILKTAKTLGAKEFLLKPFSLDNLDQAIERTLAISEYQAWMEYT